MNWRANLTRDAPSAARNATSLRRAVARTSRRFATLEQAIASSNPTAPQKTKSTLRMSRTKRSRNGSRPKLAASVCDPIFRFHFATNRSDFGVGLFE